MAATSLAPGAGFCVGAQISILPSDVAGRAVLRLQIDMRQERIVVGRLDHVGGLAEGGVHVAVLAQDGLRRAL